MLKKCYIIFGKVIVFWVLNFKIKGLRTASSYLSKSFQRLVEKYFVNCIQITEDDIWQSDFGSKFTIVALTLLTMTLCTTGTRLMDICFFFLYYFTSFSYLLSVFIKSLSLAPRFSCLQSMCNILSTSIY